MPNKNDMSDLAQFFGTIAGMVFGLVLLLLLGFVLTEKKYGKSIRALEAKISDYAAQKWNEGK